MLLRLSVVFLCLVAVSACAIQRTDLSAVKEGATRAQVERVLGKPIKSVETENGRIDTYEYNRGHDPGPMSGQDINEAVTWWYLLPIIVPIAHSINYEKQRVEIDIAYGSNDRVIGRRTHTASASEINHERQWAAHVAQIRDQADAGDAVAQTRHALSHAEGSERIEYLCRSARQGETNAQYHLGRILNEADYFPDTQTPSDPTRGLMWLTLAEKAGNAGAAYSREKFIATMTSDQITEGERLAAEWTPISPCP